MTRAIAFGIILLVLPLFPLSAQIDTTKLSSDDLFSLAREKAFAGLRDEARTLCRFILKRDPFYTDVRILLGRTLAWDGRLAEARTELLSALTYDDRHQDAFRALVDVELWDNHAEEALHVATRATSFYPNDEALLFKKARALKELGRERDALAVLAGLEHINPSNEEAARLRESIVIASMESFVSAWYAADLHADYYGPMHYTYIEAGQRTKRGTIIARLNLATRFQQTGIQPEVDAYPIFADGAYGYLNYGYSRSPLYPRHRFGAEIYSKLASSVEASGGIRLLQFDGSNAVRIYTGSLGYYFGSYWISLRPFITPNDVGNSRSLTLLVRRYTMEVETHLTLRISLGYSPDERMIQSSRGLEGREIFYLDSQTLGLGWQQLLGTQLIFNAALEFANQELSFKPGEYVMLTTIRTGLRWRF